MGFKEKGWISLVVVGTLLFGNTFTGCGNDVKSEETQVQAPEDSTEEEVKQTDTFSIGVLNKQVAPLVDEYYGFTEEELGEGVTVERQNFAAGNEAITALVNGDLDVVFGVGTLPIISTASNGFEYEIISYGTASGACYVIASDESGITDIASLKGHTIGVTFGTAAHQEILDQLRQVGLTQEDVTLVNADAESAQSAIAAGDLDAAILLYFQAASLLQSGDAVKIGEQGEGPSWVIANKEYADANPDIISGYLAALHKAGAYVETNKETVASEVGEANDMEADVFTALIEQNVAQDFLSVGDDASVKFLNDAYHFSLDQDLIDNEFDIEAYINEDYAKNAEKLLN